MVQWQYLKWFPLMGMRRKNVSFLLAKVEIEHFSSPIFPFTTKA